MGLKEGKIFINHSLSKTKETNNICKLKGPQKVKMRGSLTDEGTMLDMPDEVLVTPDVKFPEKDGTQRLK